MIDTILKIFTDWRFITSFIVFLVIITLLFFKNEFKIKLNFKKKNRKTEESNKKSQIEDDEPGKLIVPNSTYEILDKAGLIHSREDKKGKYEV